MTTEKATFKFPRAVYVTEPGHNLLRALHQIYTNVALGLNGVERTDIKDLDLPSAYNFKPSKSPVLLDEAQTSFKNWIIANGLRDCAEAVHNLLDETHSACLLLTFLANLENLTGELIEAEYCSRQQKFHRYDLGQKLRELTEKFQVTFKEDTLRCFRSLNRARNCLVHRSGIVQAADFNLYDELVVEWATYAIQRADGSEIELGQPTNSSEIWMAKKLRMRKFQLGSNINFTNRDFAEFISNYVFLAWEVTPYIQEYAYRIGALPRPNATNLEAVE